MSSVREAIRADPRLEAAFQRALSAWPRRLAPAALLGGGARAALDDPQLAAGLASDPSVQVELEIFLTSARAALASAVADGEGSDLPLGFLAALARQGFANEYVFSAEEAEAAVAQSLTDSLAESLKSGGPIRASLLLAVACYHPLHSLPGAERLLKPAWPEPIAAVIRQQVAEPRLERALQETMPQLTSVEDAVSQAVRVQYEENPYPRWTTLPVAPANLPTHRVLRAMFPGLPLSVAPDRQTQLLIAGCGTGRQALAAQLRFPDAAVLAVDLSLASLGYARRKAIEAGLERIAFAQADILKLEALDRQFDLIACSGVLHHMREPEAGLAVLTHLLKPDGLMSLALYSRAARRSLGPAERLAQRLGCSATPDGVRRLRQAILASSDPSERPPLRFSDFYTISGCRDLVMHVQEHRFDLTEVAELLRRHGLVFQSMRVEPSVMAAFRAEHPDDPEGRDLTSWAAFEAGRPDTFAAMYQFWVHKPAA